MDIIVDITITIASTHIVVVVPISDLNGIFAVIDILVVIVIIVVVMIVISAAFFQNYSSQLIFRLVFLVLN